jgi:hypothetical protein
MYIDGVPTFKDSAIMELFDRMEADGTIELVFFDGSVKTREEFLIKMKSVGTQLYMVFMKEEKYPAAFIWLDQFKHKTAHGHFCVFSSHWGDAYKIGHEVLVRLVHLKDNNDRYIFDAIYGFTPVDNELAIKATTSAGMVVAGTLPNAYWYSSDDKSHDAVMTYFTRNEVPEEELL